MVNKTSTPTILVIEDYPDSRTLLSSLLRAKGYKVVEARDGKEGLRQVNRAIPDLILMDLAMPEMDGLSTTRQLRRSLSQAVGDRVAAGQDQRHARILSVWV